jgi:hypothetical protein
MTARLLGFIFCPAIAVVFIAEALAADKAAPSYDLTDSAISTLGDKVAGHIGACMMGQGNKPKICFGLTKEFNGDPQFTFLILFGTGRKEFKHKGVQGMTTSDGATTKTKMTYDLGTTKLPLTLETKRDPRTSKVIESKAIIGELELSGKKSGVMIVDLTGEKPVYKLVKVDLPECKINLADKDHKTWADAIDAAIAELKKKSKEVGARAD